MNSHHQIARDFLDAVANGDLPDAMLTPDMTGWLTSGGTLDRASYQAAVRLIDQMCSQPLVFTINALTAEGDRVVAEVDAEGTLINGEVYRNRYVFVLRIRDGLIASVCEHYNAITVDETLRPLMRWLRQQAAND